MKKTWVLVAVFLVIGAVFYTNQQQKLQVYKVDVNGHDVYIHDLTLVNADNTLYFPSTYSFERKSDVALENVSVAISYKEEVITDWVFELDQLKVLGEHSDHFVKGITFNALPKEVSLFKRVKGVADDKGEMNVGWATAQRFFILSFFLLWYNQSY